MKTRIITIATALLLAIVPGFAQEDKESKDATPQYDMESIKKMMSNGSMPDFSAGMPSMTPVEVDAVYKFQHSVDMKVESFNSKGDLDHTMSYTMHLDEDAEYFGMETSHEMGEMKMVYEMKDHRMVMMAENGDSKMGMVHTVSDEMMKEGAEKHDNDFKKSGKTKEILGKQCEEWVGTDEGHVYSVWMATEAKFSFAKAYQEMAKAQNRGKVTGAEYPEGMLMEMTSTNAETGAKTVMVVTEIREDSKTSISTKGWTFMEMGGF